MNQSPCTVFLLWKAGCGTRLIRMQQLLFLHALLYPNGRRQNLPVPHAALVVSLSGSTCSHMSCLPCVPSPYAVRSCTRFIMHQSLPVPLAPLPEGTYSPILCPLHALCPRTIPFLLSQVRGMGACPHVYPSPLILPFSPAGAANSLERGYGGKAPPRFGRRAAFPSRLPEFLAFAKMRPANLVFAHSYYTP